MVEPWFDAWWDAVVFTASFIDYFFTLVTMYTLISCMRMLLSDWSVLYYALDAQLFLQPQPVPQSVSIINSVFAPISRTCNLATTGIIIQSLNHVCKVVNFSYRKYTNIQNYFDHCLKTLERGKLRCLAVVLCNSARAHIENSSLFFVVSSHAFERKADCFRAAISRIFVPRWGSMTEGREDDNDSRKHKRE